MKKKYRIGLVITFNLFFLFTNSQKINGIIDYKASIKNFKKSKSYKDSIKNIHEKQMYSHYKRVLKNSKNIKTKLIFNEDVSEYKNIENVNLDDSAPYNLTYVMAGKDTKFFTKRNIMQYKNSSLNCSLLGECFLIENNAIDWVLKQDKKIINGFECYRAIINNSSKSKQIVEAWYTPQIPYSYGIMNYYGLPGVVLEINTEILKITATKIQLNLLSKPEISYPKKYKEVTSKEFEKLKKKAFPMFYKN